MNRRVAYTIMLASSLIVLHFTGHHVVEGPSGFISVFPDLLSILPLPVLIFVFLRQIFETNGTRRKRLHLAKRLSCG